MLLQYNNCDKPIIGGEICVKYFVLIQIRQNK